MLSWVSDKACQTSAPRFVLRKAAWCRRFDQTPTNLIESPNGGVRRRTRKVCNWKDKNMAKRWAAAAYLRTERSFRSIMGYKDLWALKAILQRGMERAPNSKENVA